MMFSKLKKEITALCYYQWMRTCRKQKCVFRSSSYFVELIETVDIVIYCSSNCTNLHLWIVIHRSMLRRTMKNKCSTDTLNHSRSALWTNIKMDLVSGLKIRILLLKRKFWGAFKLLHGLTYAVLLHYQQFFGQLYGSNPHHVMCVFNKLCFWMNCTPKPR